VAEDIQPLDHQQIRDEALELIELAFLQGPEGEGIDLSDRAYTHADVVRLKRTLSSMRTATEVINRALAQYWESQFGESTAIELDDQRWWIAPSRQWRLLPAMEEPFAEWLIGQGREVLAKVMPSKGFRVTPIPPEARDTFMTREATTDDLRIQSKPLWKEKIA
jgi:hypothetical protein